MKKTTKKEDSKKKGKSPEKNTSPGKEDSKKGKNKDNKKEEPKSKSKKKDSKTKDQKNDNKNEKKEEDKKKKIKYNLDFIYRREQYTLKDLLESYNISKVAQLISKKIGVDAKELKIFYKERELKFEILPDVPETKGKKQEPKDPKVDSKDKKVDKKTETKVEDKNGKKTEVKTEAKTETKVEDKNGKKTEAKTDTKNEKEGDKDDNKEKKEKKDTVYEMIKNDKCPFFEVKKEVSNNQNIISLNTNLNLIYKVSCNPVTDYIDLIKKIEQFFKDICLEPHYLCEPTSEKSYLACFSCSDHCFQFKRYMMNLSRSDELYKKTEFKILKVDKNKVIEPKADFFDKNEEDNEEDNNKIKEIISYNYSKQKKENTKNNNENDNNQETTKKIKVKYEYRKVVHKEDDYFQKEFINSGPYDAEVKKVKKEDVKKKSKKKDKKWVI